MTDDYRISVRCHECGRVVEAEYGALETCPCGKTWLGYGEYSGPRTEFHGRDVVRELNGQIPFKGLGESPLPD